MTAREITATLLFRIPAKFNARVWRRNVGSMYVSDRIVNFGMPGEADIDGILGPYGRRLSIEVKVGRDKQSEAQKFFQAMIEFHGGIYIIARDVENTLIELEKRTHE